MQSFSTKDIRHHFAVDGVTYYLPGVTGADFEDLAALSDRTPEDMVMGFRDLLAARAQQPRWRFWRSPRRAVRALNPQQLNDLFNAWTGLGRSLGESSGSPASSGSTEPTSSPTSASSFPSPSSMPAATSSGT